MDAESFEKHGAQLLRYVTSYMENIRDRPAFPDVKPGYMRELIPDTAPENAEPWEAVFSDIERVIMPGVLHYRSPKSHAYWTVGFSFPSLLGDILTDATGSIGSFWETCPMSVELEMITMDWLAQMLHLPPFFLFSHPGKGGGIIEANASGAILTCLLAARTLTFRTQQRTQPDVTLGQVTDRLVAYCSDQTFPAVIKAGMLGGVRMHSLETDHKGALRGATLKAAILEDLGNGLIPFYLCATLGTTATCAFDNLKELGPLCEEHNMWMHVDAAYAGSAFICPEFRPLMDGVEYATSFNLNAHKWLKVTYECSPLWVKNTDYLQNNVKVETEFLKQTMGGDVMPDFRHWQISATSKPCRAIKVWFVLRLYGLTALQNFIRHDVAMAHEFEALVRSDVRFEIPADVIMGLVCFRLKGPNALTERLLKKLREDHKIYLIPAMMKGVYFLRLAICGPFVISSDVKYSWDVIRQAADVILGSAKE
ncbi:aromatic-L-amino-acid decarboxylase-like isoform X1 [Babylonia areolata]|uniref:aromatic-L-amino-acid decarboxylase-like isoform X1 n=1 Tax=Babylonia areolata TaxID=304850 RepID=UPI003FD352E8